MRATWVRSCALWRRVLGSPLRTTVGNLSTRIVGLGGHRQVILRVVTLVRLSLANETMPVDPRHAGGSSCFSHKFGRRQLSGANLLKNIKHSNVLKIIRACMLPAYCILFSYHGGFFLLVRLPARVARISLNKYSTFRQYPSVEPTLRNLA